MRSYRRPPGLVAGLRLLWLMVLMAGLTLYAPTVPVTAAASFTVNSTADATDFTPGNGICETAIGNGICTLRAAIQEANALPGADTIVLPAGLYILTRAGASENSAATGDLDITSDLTLIGAGADSTMVDANGLDRIFHIFTAVVQISGVTIREGNSGSRTGGGLRLEGGSLTLSNSAVVDSIAFSGGGALSSPNGAAVTIRNSTISGNTASNNGGGLNIRGGTITLVNSTLSGNTANGHGGGLYITNSAAASLANVTVTDNRADGDSSGGGNGGGLSNNGGTITFKNTLMAGNFDNSAGTRRPDCSGTLTSQGYNLVGDKTGCTFTPASSDLVGTGSSPVNAQLGPLQNNGGPTPTHALLSGSPATDAGNPALPGSGGNACEATDQRGIVRPQGSTCDIGAYEVVVPDVQFSGGNFTVDEAAAAATITVALSAAPELTATVGFTTTNGTALAGGDYLTTTGVLTFTPGVITRTFTVPILDDVLDEPDEALTLTLGNPANATLGQPNPATLTILDDDVYGLTLAPATEGKAGIPGATVTYILTLTNTGNVTDTYSVTIAGAVFTTTATLPTVGPFAPNQGGTFVVSVQIPPSAIVGTLDNATVTVRSQGNNSQSAAATLTTTVVAVPVTGGVVIYLPVIANNP